MVEQCREHDEVSGNERIFRDVVKGWGLGPFEGPPILKPPALPGDIYFIGFLPKPMPDQTIEDVCRAQGAFLEEVINRHRRRSASQSSSPIARPVGRS